MTVLSASQFLLALLELVVPAAILLLGFWMILDVLRRRDVPALRKVLWVVFVLVIPYLGIPAYLGVHAFSRTDLSRAKQWTWLIAMLLVFVVFASAYVIINRKLLAERRSGHADGGSAELSGQAAG